MLWVEVLPIHHQPIITSNSLQSRPPAMSQRKWRAKHWYVDWHWFH
jgi:hypothetical protein